jgi:hypothetical protein
MCITKSANINYYYQCFIVDQPEYFLYVSFIILIKNPYG